MKKFIVNIQLPTSGNNYDVYLPAGKRISEIVGLLVDMAGSLTNGAFKGTDISVLLNADSGEPLARDVTVYDAGIRNSSRLILI